MELFEETRPGANEPEFTVAEISGAVRRVIEGEFGRVRVRGEVGRVSRPASGHLYLDLKDDRAVLNAVIWKGAARGLAVQPEEGMEVVATGRLTTFPGASRYQMVIEALAPAGVGALMAYAGVQGAIHNVRINLPNTKDEEFISRMKETLDDLLSESKEICDAVQAQVASSY